MCRVTVPSSINVIFKEECSQSNVRLVCCSTPRLTYAIGNQIRVEKDVLPRTPRPLRHRQKRQQLRHRQKRQLRRLLRPPLKLRQKHRLSRELTTRQQPYPQQVATRLYVPRLMTSAFRRDVSTNTRVTALSSGSATSGVTPIPCSVKTAHNSTKGFGSAITRPLLPVMIRPSNKQ